MAFGFGRNNDDDIDWIRDPDRDGEPRDRQFAKRRGKETGGRTVRWILWGILALLVAVLYYQMNPVDRSAPTPGTDLDPAGKTQAWSLTEDWLEGGPLGPGARIVSWDGAQGVDYKDSTKTTHAMAHRLTVDSSLGWWSVETVVLPDGTLAAYPSPTRVQVPTVSSPGAQGEWPSTLATFNAPATVTTLLDKWAAALAGSDSDLLTVVMRDPDPAAQYQAQSLGTVAGVTVERTAYLDRGKVDRNNQRSDRAAVRVTITLAPRDQNSAQTSMAYDVLIADPDGAPAILAWGAPGTADRLAEYANRLPAGQTPVDYSKQAAGAAAQSAAGGTQAAAK